MAVTAGGSRAPPATLLVTGDALLPHLVPVGVLGAEVRAVAVQTAVVLALLAVHEARAAASVAEPVARHAHLHAHRHRAVGK